jgi:hypothetical protein
LLFAAFLLLARLATAQTDYLASIKNLPDHLRILLLKNEEAAIIRAVGTDKTRAGVQQAILTESGAITKLPLSECIKTSRLLLSVSREALRRVFFLACAWRMTKQDAYLKRVENELLAVSAELTGPTIQPLAQWPR